MVRPASGIRFLRANPVASIRLEGLLVRSALSNPVRKNRGVMEWDNAGYARARPGKIVRNANTASRRVVRDTKGVSRKTVRDANSALCRK